MKLTIAVCDDEHEALESEASLISSVLDEKEVEYDIDKFDLPAKLLSSEKEYDIIILDIETDGINGIDAAEKLRRLGRKSLIFFVTNYETYLDEAFNKRAFRFWTKPLDRVKLSYGLDSAMKELKALKSDDGIIVTAAGNKEIKIPVKKIIYVYVQLKKVHIVTAADDIAVNNNYKNICEQLNAFDDFFESHRGYIVNFNYINSYSADKIICGYNGKTYEAYLSRRKYNDFCKRFIEWIGEK